MTIDRSVLLDQRYRLDERIGTGGMADVFRGTDELLNRRVAVKVLRRVSEPGLRARFVEEACTLAMLNHPGLVTLLDAGIQCERPYLVMALADDDNLALRIARGPLDATDVRTIGVQVARALAYAHGQRVVHRDVKPSNVLLCADGRALLADFGIARLVGSAEHHTHTGDVIGSPAYLAPEQVAGEELTPAVDIYSFGLVLLEALTGQRAFTGTPVEAAVARLNMAPPIPPILDPSWRELLASMTERIAENRPSAAEVADSLPDAGATAELAVTVESPFQSAGPAVLGATNSVARAPRQRSRQAAGLALVVVAIVTALVLMLRPVDSSAKIDDPGVPSGVPAKYQPSLANLHDALNGPAR